jgi:hypothetical protein
LGTCRQPANDCGGSQDCGDGMVVGFHWGVG